MKKLIHISYHASLREQRGAAEDHLETEAATPSELYGELQAQFNLRIPMDRMQVAVNDHMSAWDTALATDDTVTFVPPVAGG